MAAEGECAWSGDSRNLGTKNNSNRDEIELSNQQASEPSNAAQNAISENAIQNNALLINNGMFGMQATENVILPSTSCNFQVAKPKLPKCSGDVRDYATFK